MRKIIIFPVILFSLGLSLLCKARADDILTWEDCLREAKKNHPDLISAEESVKQKKAARQIAASGLYPQVNGNLDASITMSRTTNATTGKTTSAAYDSYSYGLSGTQTIFDGLKTSSEVKSASEDIKAAQEGYRFVSSQVRFDLRAVFIDLLKAQELINVADEIVKIRRDNLELITLRYHSGLEHKGALLTAEANMAQADFELSQAKRDVEFAQRQLTKELGRSEFRPICVKGDFIVRDTAEDQPDFEELIKNNPSLLEALAKKNAAAFDIKSAYADFFPQLSGQIDAGKSDSRWPPRNRQLNMGLSVNMPLFDAGLRSARLAQAKSLYEQAEADERSARDGIIVSMEQAWTSLQDTIETAQVKYKSLEAAQERSRIAQAQYSTGFIDFDSWIIIENDLVSAKKAYLQVQADALLAEASWIYAKGETLEYAQ